MSFFSNLKKSFGLGSSAPASPKAPATDAKKSATKAHPIAPRPLRVAEVVRETADAVSIHLEEPSGAPIVFRPGQFLTFEVALDGMTYRRAYSLSSDPAERQRVSVTVKRIANGKVSTHFNANLKAGDTLQVLGPSGFFGVDADAERNRHVVLLAGGSGITPMMAIARALLNGEPGSRVTLVYGNRGVPDIIFARTLEALVQQHAGRLVVRHVLSEAPAGWSGGTGLLTRDVTARELDALGIGNDAEFLLCGPEAMRVEVRFALAARGIGDERIQEERFVSPPAHAENEAGSAGTSGGLVTLRGTTSEKQITVKPGQTILDAGLAAGFDMPYSCAMGGCATCRVKLHSGEVEMDEPNCLSVDEKREGYILACVSRVKSPVVVEVDADLG